MSAVIYYTDKITQLEDEYTDRVVTHEEVIDRLEKIVMRLACSKDKSLKQMKEISFILETKNNELKVCANEKLLMSQKIDNCQLKQVQLSWRWELR